MTWMHHLADVNSGSWLHPLLDSLQRHVPLVSNPFIQVLGHFLCLQGVPKSCQQNLQNNVGRLDFWTTLGHPGYLGEVGPLWPKNRVSQHCPQNSVSNFLGISFWFLVLSEDNEMLKVVD